ncbi:MAG: SUMF1/EgtB/PvdO family nonheme iron enzyme [Planctomycetaceae bacterium]|nr:SUMF1/EgtB/PvdO family nonheme iron enzyme [Planctomycetaceae bacterium]
MPPIRQNLSCPGTLRPLGIACLLLALGCSSSTDSGPSTRQADTAQETETRTLSGDEAPPSPLSADRQSWPAEITNRFGMTFSLVTIDPTRPDHNDAFPQQTYYIQQSVLTGSQMDAFNRAAVLGGVYTTDPRRSLPTPLVQPNVSLPRGNSPSEWSECFWYARALSTLDPDFDYRLPTRKEWTFACKSGYEQRCDGDDRNAYRCRGMQDPNGPDAEAVAERWGEHGQSAVLMGYWKNNWGVHDDREEPDCLCDHWTICNPDGDDSLNERITARFILMPKQNSTDRSR